MDFSIYDHIIIGGYLLALLIFAVHFARKPMDEGNYMLAARRLSLPAFVMTLVTTWYGLILGVGEFVFGNGIVAWVTNGLLWYIVYFIFAFFLAKRIHDSKHLTIADQFKAKSLNKSAKAATLITYVMTTPAPYILSLAILVQQIFGLSFTAAVFSGLFFSAAYVWSGGFQAVVKTDMFQFIFMYLGFGLLLVFSFMQFGGLDFLQSHLPETHLTFKGELSWQTIIVWGFLAFWTLVDPNFFQRCYAAKDGNVAKKGVLWAIFFWFIFDMLTLTTGLYARAAFPDATGLFAYFTLADGVLPIVAKGIFFVAILAIIMSTIDSFLFTSGSILAADVLSKKFGKYSVKNLTRAGILISLVLCLGIIYFFESVIGIVYAIGTVGVSALLLPMLLILFSKNFSFSDRAIFSSMIAAALVSGGWMIDGWLKQEFGWPNYFLSIEPMYVGILTSTIILCGASLKQKLTRNKTALT